MDYRKLYNQIVENRKNNRYDGYTETHHIIPKCLGGSDEPKNLVKLSCREHFICHYLLTKIYRQGSNEWHKMIHAFIPMKSASMKQERYFNSRLYESVRNNFSEIMKKNQSGKKNSQYGKRWIHNKLTQESKKIPKENTLPLGWSEGRVINWNHEFYQCLQCFQCSKDFQHKYFKKYCSNQCKKDAQKLERIKSDSYLAGREEEFLTLYKQYASMNKALKEMGLPGAMGGYYHWAKSLI